MYFKINGIYQMLFLMILEENQTKTVFKLSKK